MTTATPLFRYAYHDLHPPNEVAFSPNREKQTLAVACHDGAVRVYDVRPSAPDMLDRAPAQELRRHYGSVTSVSWSLAGHLASCGVDSRIIDWGPGPEAGEHPRLGVRRIAGPPFAADQEQYNRLMGRRRGWAPIFTQIRWASAGIDCQRILAVLTAGGQAFIYDTWTETRLYTLACGSSGPPHGAFTWMIWHPHNMHLVLGNPEGRIEVFDFSSRGRKAMTSDTPQGDVGHFRGPVQAITYHPHRAVISANRGGRHVETWNYHPVAGDTLVSTDLYMDDVVTDLKWSGSRLAVAAGSKVRVFPRHDQVAEQGEPQAPVAPITLDHPRNVVSIDICPSDHLLAVAHRGGVWVWDLNDITKQLQRQRVARRQPTRHAYEPRLRRLQL